MARTGRPRRFDRDMAVREAMHVFWEHGYSGTSLALLKAKLGGGITATSFYAAFGSKEALFCEVAARYAETHGQVLAPLFDEAQPALEAIATALRASAAMQVEGGHPRGCFAVFGASAAAPQDTHLRKFMLEQRQRSASGFRQAVERGIGTGELAPGTDAAGLTAMLQAFLLGLSSQARDGAGAAELDAAVSAFMTLLDAPSASA